MSNVLTVYIDFQDGYGWRDITSLTRRDVNVTHRASSDDFHFAQNVASFNIKYDSVIYPLLVAAEEKILVKILKDNLPFFQGYVPPTLVRNYNGILTLNEIELEAIDSADELRKPVGDVIYTNIKILDPADTENSLVHKLAGIAGITASGIDSSITISDVIEGFAPSSEDSKIIDLLDTVLYEYGYILNFNASNQISPIKWIVASGTIFNFDETNISLSVQRKETDRSTYDGVKVIWYDLDTKTNTLLYREDLPYDEYGQFEGYPIPSGYYFPVEANVFDDALGANQIVYQEYEDTGILYKTNKAIAQNLDFNYKAFESDFTEIVRTYNHTLEVSYDAGITIEEQNFYNKKAQVLFYNGSDASKNLYYFNIRGDILYKTSERYSQITLVSGTTNLYPYESEFVFEKVYADALAQGIAKNLELGNVYYSFKSEEEVAVGSIVRITTQDYTDQDCFVLERTYSDIEEMFTYQLKSFNANYASMAPAIVVTRPKAPDPITEQQLASFPSYEDLQYGYVAASGVVTPSTIGELYAHGLFKGVFLNWENQLNLTNFKEYHIQVSASGIDPWYPLEFDRTDWKKTTVSGYTVWPIPFLTHSTPLAGTEEAPEDLPLFYRVRQNTKADVTSDWSIVVSGIASSVDTGDIAENSITVNKLTVGILQAMFANISKSITIGYYGTGTYDNPDEGDRRVYIDGDEIGFQQYNLGEWSTVNSIIIGGADINGGFLPFLGCRGIYNQLGTSPNPDVFPGGTYIDFENGLLDQNGDGPAASTDVGVTTTDKKFGNYSVTGTDAATAGILNYTFDELTDKNGAIASCYVKTPGTSFVLTLMHKIDSNNYYGIFMYQSGAGYLSVEIIKRIAGVYDAELFATNIAIDTGEWHCVSVGWNEGRTIAYATIDDAVYSAEMDITDVVGVFTVREVWLRPGKSGDMTYIDDVLFFVGEVSPQLITRHYEADEPWDITRVPEDLILKAATGGVVRSIGDHVIEGDLIVNGGITVSSGISVDWNQGISSGDVLTVLATGAQTYIGNTANLRVWYAYFYDLVGLSQTEFVALTATSNDFGGNDYYFLARYSVNRETLGITVMGSVLTLTSAGGHTYYPAIDAFDDTDVVTVVPYTDYIRVYRWNGTNWVMYGASLTNTSGGVTTICAVKSDGTNLWYAFIDGVNDTLKMVHNDGTNATIKGTIAVTGYVLGALARIDDSHVLLYTTHNKTLTIYEYDYGTDAWSAVWNDSAANITETLTVQIKLNWVDNNTLSLHSGETTIPPIFLRHTPGDNGGTVARLAVYRNNLSYITAAEVDMSCFLPGEGPLVQVIGFVSSPGALSAAKARYIGIDKIRRVERTNFPITVV